MYISVQAPFAAFGLSQAVLSFTLHLSQSGCFSGAHLLEHRVPLSKRHFVLAHLQFDN